MLKNMEDMNMSSPGRMAIREADMDEYAYQVRNDRENRQYKTDRSPGLVYRESWHIQSYFQKRHRYFSHG